MPAAPRAARQSALAGALACFAAACGSIGDPLPPLANLPAPVEDLEARQVGEWIEVSWTRPRATTEGTVARDVGGYTLWAVDVPDIAAALTPETVDQYRRVAATLDEEDAAAAQPDGRRTLRSPLAAWPLGQPAVLVLTAWNRAERDGGYSNQVPIQPLEPPAAPQLQEPAVTADGVDLQWLPGRLAEEYGIERADGDEAAFASLGRMAALTFLDRTARFGTAYRYRLRPYRMSAAGRIEGPLSETVAVTPADVFPPAQPRGLRAVRTPEAVELSWLPNDEGDLAGYRVVRGGAAISPLLTGLSYSDRSTIAGTPYVYAILAVDADGNASAPGEPLTVPPGRAAPD